MPPPGEGAEKARKIVLDWYLIRIGRGQEVWEKTLTLIDDRSNKDLIDAGGSDLTRIAYALALMRRGVGRDEIEQRIRTERSDWRHHQGERSMRDYFKRTLDRAQTIIDRSPATLGQGGRQDPGRSMKEIPEPEGRKEGLGQGMGL